MNLFTLVLMTPGQHCMLAAMLPGTSDTIKPGFMNPLPFAFVADRRRVPPRSSGGGDGRSAKRRVRGRRDRFYSEAGGLIARGRPSPSTPTGRGHSAAA